MKDLIRGVQVQEVRLGEDLYLTTKPGWTAEARRKWGPGEARDGPGFSFSLVTSQITQGGNNNSKPAPCAPTAFPAGTWNHRGAPWEKGKGLDFTPGYWHSESRGSPRQLQPHKAGRVKRREPS